jgi:hypothetical protein
LIRTGLIDVEVGLSYATNVGNMRLQLADFFGSQERTAGSIKKRGAAERGQVKPEKTEVSAYE